MSKILSGLSAKDKRAAFILDPLDVTDIIESAGFLSTANTHGSFTTSGILFQTSFLFILRNYPRAKSSGGKVLSIKGILDFVDSLHNF